MRKRIIILLISVTGVALWVLRERQIVLSRQELAGTASRQAGADRRIADALAALAGARRELDSQKTAQATVIATTKKIAGDVAKANPDSLWAEPPATWPDWNSNSPYIWLPKGMVPRVGGFNPFGKNGELLDIAADVMAVGPEARRDLNEKLKQIVDSFHTAESSNIARLDKLPEEVKADGPAAAIELIPVPGAREEFESQFHTALEEALGGQRADLLTECQPGYVDRDLRQFGVAITTVALVRHPSGRFSIFVRAGVTSLSLEIGARGLGQFIPDFAMPFFQNVIGNAASADGPEENTQ